MNANELADDAKNISNAIEALEWVQKAVPMLRQQQAEIEAQKADATKWFLKYQECFVHGIKEAK